MNNYKRVISFGAHPLDAELQGGPMIIKYSSQGAKCTFVHMTKGRLTDPKATEDEKKGYEEKLLSEMQACDSAMGGECKLLGYTSSTLPSEEDMIKWIMDYLKQEKADCVITHARGTLHPRHYYTYETVTEAVRRLHKEGISIRLYYGENCEDLGGFVPGVYVSQTQDELDRWFNALRKYTIFNGGVNNMPYYEYYHAMAIIHAVEVGQGPYAKAYMQAAVIDNE